MHLLEKQYTLLKFDVNLVNLNEIKKQIDFFQTSITNIFSEIQKNIENKIINDGENLKIELKKESVQTNLELQKKLDLMYGDYALLVTRLDALKTDHEKKIGLLEIKNAKLENYFKAMNIGLAVLFVCVCLQQYQIYFLTHNTY
jgi:hypothetical protein